MTVVYLFVFVFVYCLFLFVQDFVEPVNEDSGTAEESEVTTPTTTTTTASEEPPAPAERKTNFQKVVVTEVESANHFWAQSVENGKW